MILSKEYIESHCIVNNHTQVKLCICGHGKSDHIKRSPSSCDWFDCGCNAFTLQQDLNSTESNHIQEANLRNHNKATDRTHIGLIKVRQGKRKFDLPKPVLSRP